MRRVLIRSYRVARRIVVATVGATVLALGLALTVLPGPAFLVIPLGLAILGLEFAWARRWLRRLKDGANAVKNGLERRRRGGGGTALSLALLLPLFLGGRCGSVAVWIGLPEAATGQLLVEIRVPDGLTAAGLEVALDGSDVTDLFSPKGQALVGLIDDPAPGRHQLAVRRSLVAGLVRTWSVPFESPGPAPTLRRADPEAGAPAARSAWLRFDFAAPPATAALAGWGFGVECGGEAIPGDVLVARGTSVVVNPALDLPAGASCRAAWRGPGGEIVEHPFSVAEDAPGRPAKVHYDRSDPFALPPLPDDYWLVADEATGAGGRLALEAPPYPPGILRAGLRGVAASLADRDGWSPVQPFVVSLSHAPDLANLPRSEAESLDPFATLGLYDMDPASPDYGERFPFTLSRRSDYFPSDMSFDHSLVLLPARSLRPGGVYALAVTRRLFAAGAPGRPLGPSAFFSAVADHAPVDASAPLLRARTSIVPALEFLAAVPELPIPRQDLALALRITIRSESLDPADWVAVKELALAAPPPLLDVASETRASGGDLVLRGTLPLPFYLDDSYTEVHRDPAGAPLARADASEAERQVPFVFRIPEHATPPLPIVIYQHGSPGSPEEINSASEEFLLEAGYALIGIQDLGNRLFSEDRSAQGLQILARVAFAHHMPLLHFQTHADLFGLLRTIQGMGSAASFPEIDPSQIYFRGISYGAHHSLGFLPFAPEVSAAVGVAGGGRYFENVIHQLDFFDTLAAFRGLVPAARPATLLAAFAALQGDADRDDPGLLARHLYREPLAVRGQDDDVPASLLWIEGVGDGVVSSTATRAAADELGIPLVRPVVEGTSFQAELAAPVTGNIAPGVAAGHFQYLPASTPSCVAAGQTEGHYCPQSALEAEAQILHFFASSGAGDPEILSPLEDAP